MIGPAIFGFLYYIFLLINNEYDLPKNESRFDIKTASLFSDGMNYFIVFFTVVSATAIDYLFERIYDFFFNLALVLLRNKKFKDGKLKIIFF